MDTLAAIGWPPGPLAAHFLLAAALLWPLVRLCGRAGLARGWALLVLVPVFGPALIGTLLAFKRWPTVPPLPKRRRRRA